MLCISVSPPRGGLQTSCLIAWGTSGSGCWKWEERRSWGHSQGKKRVHVTWGGYMVACCWGGFFYNRTPRKGGKRGAGKPHTFCGRPRSCLYAPPAPYKWVMGVEQKPRRYLSLVGMWLGTSRKPALQKLRDPEASVLLGGARFVTHQPGAPSSPTSSTNPSFQRGPGADI